MACRRALSAWLRFSIDKTKYRSRVVSHLFLAGRRAALRSFRHWRYSAVLARAEERGERQGGELEMSVQQLVRC